MSHEERLGWAALVLALLGTGALYLWPTERWIGWTVFGGGVVSGLIWAYLEIEPLIGDERILRRFLACGFLSISILVTIGLNWTKRSSTITQNKDAVNATDANTAHPGTTDTATAQVNHPKPKPISRTSAVKSADSGSTQAPKENAPFQTIIQVTKSLGNLKERALTLSDEIMRDLYSHGWKNGSPEVPVMWPLPTTEPAMQEWLNSRSRHFRFRCFDEALGIRNDLAQQNYRERRLEEFFKSPEAATGSGLQISPQQIEEVAEGFRALAGQIKQP